MKKTIFYLFCLLSWSLYAQVRISGTVYDQNNRPLQGASVYLNNTSIGSTTDNDGFFEFETNAGVYTLVVSFVGYETKTQKLKTRSYKKPFRFKLKVKNNVLDQVVLKKVKRMSRSKRNAYLRKFQKAFLGQSEFGRKAKVLNKEVLDYEVSSYDDTFEVYASEPIKILNPKLGYVLYYDLVHFELTPVSISYFGYIRYEKIDLEEQNKKWEKNRLKAYQGSQMHFLRSVRNEEVKDQGFVVDNLKRIPNPERPSNQEIKKALEFLQKTQGLQNDPYKSSSALNDKIIAAQKTLELAKLPEFIDEVLDSNMILMKYGFADDVGIYLQFFHTLRVTYLDEKPDKNYDTSQSSSEYQVTMLNLYKKKAYIHESGIFERPYDVFLRGYWAFEKVGDKLPLDYIPPHKERPMYDSE
jgi:hypothetical protein